MKQIQPRLQRNLPIAGLACVLFVISNVVVSLNSISNKNHSKVKKTVNLSRTTSVLWDTVNDGLFESKWGKYHQCLNQHCMSIADNAGDILPLSFKCDHRNNNNSITKDHDMRFYACLIEASRDHNQQVIRSLNNQDQSTNVPVKGEPNNLDRVYGPHLPLIALTTFLTKEIVDYTVYSIAVNLAFAIYHHHLFFVMDDFYTNTCNPHLMMERDSTNSNTYCANFTNLNKDAQQQREIDLLLDTYDNRWSKVGLLLTLSENSEIIDNQFGKSNFMWDANQADYFMWLDADLIVLDLINLRLQEIIAENPKAHFLASAEHAGSTTMINSGSVLVKNSQWTRTFLRQWWEIQNRRLLSDQEQFDLLYQTLLSSSDKGTTKQRQYLETKIKILPPYALNSDPPAMTKQQAHHPVLHLMGEEKDFRIRAFSTATSHILEHLEFCIFQLNHNLVKPVHPLQSQLTLTQRNLLIWTIEEYSGYRYNSGSKGDSPRIEKLFVEYKALANHGFADVEAGRYLSNVVHHFAFAVEHLHYKSDSIDDDTNYWNQVNSLKQSFPLYRVHNMRIQVYQLLLLNIQRLQHKLEHEKREKHRIGESFRYPRDYPELVKGVAIAGQQLLLLETDSPTMSDSKQVIPLSLDKVKVAQEVGELLQEMLNTANEKQHDAIYHMIAHHKIQQCMMAMGNVGETVEIDVDKMNDVHTSVSNALIYCEDSLKVFQRLVPISGSHILVNPLMLTANLLSSLRRFREAYDHYEAALQIIKSSNYGSVHDPLSLVIPLLLNYGTALVQGLNIGARTDVARSILEECRNRIIGYRLMTKDDREVETLYNYLNRVNAYLEQIGN